MAEPTTIDEIREEREKGKLQIAKGKLQAKLEFQRSQLNSLQRALHRCAPALFLPGPGVLSGRP